MAGKLARTNYNFGITAEVKSMNGAEATYSNFDAMSIDRKYPVYLYPGNSHNRSTGISTGNSFNYYHHPNNIPLGTVFQGGDNDSNAIYFSRKALPYNRSKSNLKHYKHIGVYAFRKKALFSFSKLKKSVLEKAEMIEAIRFIENGIKIKILEVFNEYISIDTIEDLKRVKKILND